MTQVALGLGFTHLQNNPVGLNKPGCAFGKPSCTPVVCGLSAHPHRSVYAGPQTACEAKTKQTEILHLSVLLDRQRAVFTSTLRFNDVKMTSALRSLFYHKCLMFNRLYKNAVAC